MLTTAPSSSKHKIWLVEPNPFFSLGLKVLLDKSEFSIARQETSVGMLLNPTEVQYDPPAAIVVSLGYSYSFYEACAQGLDELSESFVGIPTIILAERLSVAQFQSVMKAGVRAYISRGITLEGLRHSVLLAIAGENVFPSEFVEVLLTLPAAESDVSGWGKSSDPSERRFFGGDDENGLQELTQQEWRVLHLIIEGCPNKLIANKLNIAEGTVKVHVKTLLRKIQVENRTAAAVWALQNKARLNEIDIRLLPKKSL